MTVVLAGVLFNPFLLQMTRCAAFLSSGRRCKRTASHDDYCFQHLSDNRKRCGHNCFLNTDKCCECEDLRPHDQSLYTRYIDGTGRSYAVGCRADGYCPACKPRCMTSNVTVRPITPYPTTPVRPTMNHDHFTPPPAPRKLRYEPVPAPRSLIITISEEDEDTHIRKLLSEMRVSRL